MVSLKQKLPSAIGTNGFELKDGDKHEGETTKLSRDLERKNDFTALLPLNATGKSSCTTRSYTSIVRSRAADVPTEKLIFPNEPFDFFRVCCPPREIVKASSGIRVEARRSYLWSPFAFQWPTHRTRYPLSTADHHHPQKY